MPAPAKVNLFLHILGRRPDGYHLLQSAFELIDWSDQICLQPRKGEAIERLGDLLGAADDDLAVRAARALQQTLAWHNQPPQGAVIQVHKSIPAGAGLGGGSSDAASTLIGLNHLWNLRLSNQELAEIGLSLGADVPFFVFGAAAFAEGVGERLQAYATVERWLVMAVPRTPVSTGVIFASPELTRDSKPLKIADFAQAALKPVWTFGRNDLEPVTQARFKEVGQVMSLLKQAAASENVAPDAVRMSGSGGAVFCTAPSQEKAQKILNFMAALRQTPDGSCIAHLNICRTLASHPARQLV